MVSNLPGVGENLQDHVIVPQIFETIEKLGYNLEEDKVRFHSFSRPLVSLLLVL